MGVMYPLCSKESEILLQINLSSLQHLVLYDKNHKIIYSNLSPKQWIPSALPCNRIREATGKNLFWRNHWALVTEDEPGDQLPPPLWSLPGFSQAVYNHTALSATAIPCSWICCNTSHFVYNRVFVCACILSSSGEWVSWRLGPWFFLRCQPQRLPRGSSHCMFNIWRREKLNDWMMYSLINGWMNELLNEWTNEWNSRK